MLSSPASTLAFIGTLQNQISSFFNVDPQQVGAWNLQYVCSCSMCGIQSQLHAHAEGIQCQLGATS